ncbi:ATP-binding protein [Streptomyces sp. NPDC060235]|uniref:ATP-binding protein n=1 Tax=Streptomyces sp. NPDC060235 TaxID=3347080 RepID=UPI003654A97E
MDEPPTSIDGQEPGADLPLETSLALDGDGSVIAQARHVAATFLAKVHDDAGIPVATATVEIAQLIISELVTNARKYAPGPALLRLRVVDGGPQIHLSDGNPIPPAPKPADPGRIGQHGLEIVAALAQYLSVQATTAGKCVTAIVTLAPGP